MEAPMTDTVWISAVTVMVLGYLMYALLMPEKF
ncbi:MAG TPA: potassium-transporting ATPase subunit F [Polyangiaceae bacterium]|nr:potassium-transporting ATPase subunit F [Polyangiaceae bacterium]